MLVIGCRAQAKGFLRLMQVKERHLKVCCSSKLYMLKVLDWLIFGQYVPPPRHDCQTMSLLLQCRAKNWWSTMCAAAKCCWEPLSALGHRQDLIQATLHAAKHGCFCNHSQWKPKLRWVKDWWGIYHHVIWGIFRLPVALGSSHLTGPLSWFTPSSNVLLQEDPGSMKISTKSILLLWNLALQRRTFSMNAPLHLLATKNHLWNGNSLIMGRELQLNHLLINHTLHQKVCL